MSTRVDMDERTRHLLWGLVLFAVFVVLDSYDLPLLHLCGALKSSQTLALMFIGEAATLLPFSPLVWRQWSLTGPKEYAIFGLQGFLLGAFLATVVYDAKNMTLGTMDVRVGGGR